MDNNEIAISVVVPVYNHEKYIKKALYSILKQKVNFRYEVVIGEDCSTDHSREILKELEKELPDYFRFFYYEHNMGGSGKGNIDYLHTQMSGKYFCTLEGDDYWTYENKLQEQYDFLEAHPEFLAVAHNTKVVDENDEEVLWKYPECKNEEFLPSDYEKGLMAGQTATLLVRNYYTYPIFDEELEPCKIVGDRRRNFMLFCNGRVRCIQKQWSCYRLVLSHGSSFSANAKRMTTEDEFGIYRSFYNYVRNHDIPKEKYAVIEDQFFYFIFKQVLARRMQPAQFFENYKTARRKAGVVGYLIKNTVERPFYTMKKKQTEKAYRNE